MRNFKIIYDPTFVFKFPKSLSNVNYFIHYILIILVYNPTRNF